MGVKIIVYTHTDYKWVWPLWFGQTQKHLQGLDKVIFVDKLDVDIPHDYTIITYDTNLAYNQRIATCLQRLDPESVVIFHHEDMFLLDQPRFDVIREFESIVNNQPDTHIKLLRACDGIHQPHIHKLIYKNPTGLNYSIQPTLTKVKSLYNIHINNGGNTIWEFESNAGTKHNTDNSYYCYDGEKLRGSAHYDSSVYPYIATAVVKGEWNMNEYSDELTKLFYEYKINYI